MRGFWFKRGRRRAIRRSAAVLAIFAAGGLADHFIPTDGVEFYSGLVIGEASARPKARPGNEPPRHKLQQAKQQLQSLQNAVATQNKLQQIQATIAAQQKHVQNVQKMIAAHKQKMQTSLPPGSLPKLGQPPQPGTGGNHQALIQKALAQVKAAKQAPNAGVPAAHKMKALVAKLSGNQTSRPQHGQHHLALVKAALQHAKQQKAISPLPGKHQAASQLVYQQILSKLKGRGQSGGHHVAKYQAVFQHILAKLSAKNKQTQPSAPAPAPTVVASATPQKKTTNVQPSLPIMAQPATGPTVVAVVSSAVSSVIKSDSGEGGESNSTAGLLGSTISKLGGPKLPTEPSSGSAGSVGRPTSKAGRDDDDDDGRDGGIVNILRKSGKAGREGSVGALNPLASLPAVGTFNPRQVLAINLNDAGLKKIKSLHFKVKDVHTLPLLGITITKLEAPANESAVTSLAKLEEMVLDSAFALNRVYVPYRLGAARAGTPPGRPRRLDSTCDPDRCFAASLINWRPQLANCGQGVRIGIIDTGVDATHPALRDLDNIAYAQFVPEGSARASRDHGTGIVSLLAGRPESSVPGLVPRAKYYVANAFYADTNDGPAMSETDHILHALDWLGRENVQILNLSFSGPRDELVHRAIKKLARKGVIVVAAAGNDGPNAPAAYPAAYDEVVAVTAVDRYLAPYRYANRGDHIAISAPGVGIWTALANRGEGPQTGTSFAAPHVTGVLALYHSVIASMDESLSPKERALQVLISDAIKLGGPHDKRIFGAGLVRAPDACPSPAGAAVAGATPSTLPSESVVVKASRFDWFKATTVRMSTGN